MRIRLVVATLVLVVVLVGGLSIYYMKMISDNAETIFSRNYELSMESRQVDNDINRIKLDLALFQNNRSDSAAIIKTIDSLIERIDSSLVQQKMLVQFKEVSEQSMVMHSDLRLDSLKTVWNAIKADADSIALVPPLSVSIQNLEESNMRLYRFEENDVQHRFQRTRKTITRVIFYMAIIGANFTIIAIIFLVLFPAYIVEPVVELTESIKAISRKDFNRRIESRKTDEFGELAEAFNEMAQRLDHYEHLNVSEILKEKQRIEAIINNLNEAILVTDEAGRVVWVNNVAVNLVGKSRQDMLEQKINEIQAANPSIDSNYDDGSGDAMRQELFNTTAIVDGRKKYYHKEVISVGANIGGNVIIYYDITPFKELDQAKTNFMATLSHQFKTPISAANISLNLLSDTRIGELNDEQKKLLETVKIQNKRLLNMVNELLDVSQIETGRIKLKKEKFLPANVAEYALFTIKNLLEEKQVQVKKSFEPIDDKIEGDMEKLTWVLNNILINAMRFSTRGGSIHVEIKRKKNKVIFSIHDDGPGISEEDQKNIFERYAAKEIDNIPGSGLGLSIAKDIIKAHNGEIGVHSRLNKGSTFYFELPLAIS